MHTHGPRLKYNRRKRIHEKGRQKLPYLLEKGGHRCHWCDKPLILARVLRPELIILKSADWVIWLDGHEERRSYWATTDHIIPVRDGGKSNIENLVASCPGCNRNRTRSSEWEGRDKPKWIGSSICKCGNQKPIPNRRCDQCKALSDDVKKLAKRTFISRTPGQCKRCSTVLIELDIVQGLGVFYGCPTCIVPINT